MEKEEGKDGNEVEDDDERKDLREEYENTCDLGEKSPRRCPWREKKKKGEEMKGKGLILPKRALPKHDGNFHVLGVPPKIFGQPNMAEFCHVYVPKKISGKISLQKTFGSRHIFAIKHGRIPPCLRI